MIALLLGKRQGFPGPALLPHAPGLTMLGAMLLTEHNLSFYQALMAGMRSSIASGTMDRFVSAFSAQYGSRE